MQKKLIALAIAGLVAAPAFAATSNVDVYGKIRTSIDHLSGSATTSSGWQMSDETSRFGIKGSEDLGGGLKAIYQWEAGLNGGTLWQGTTGNAPAAASGGGLAGQRNTFVGLAGDFGTALVGRYDSPYKSVGSADLFGDTLADAQSTNATTCIICRDDRLANAIAYVSPNFSGLTLSGASVVGNNKNGTVASQSLNETTALAATYANGPLGLGLGYQNANGTTNGEKDWKLTGSYKVMGDLKLGATYEKQTDIAAKSGADSKNYLLSAAYSMGSITLAAQYGKRDQNTTAGNKDLKDTTVGVMYGLSKRTSTYMAYAHYKTNAAAANTTNAFTVGLNHDF